MNREAKLIEKAKQYIKYNHSDAYIQSMMWASRNNDSMTDINNAIKKAKECNEIKI